MPEPSADYEAPWWARPWWPTGPQVLSQPILPGWTFGGVTINEQNSSAPGTEQAIVAGDSYGRQIGKLLDAVALLVEARGDAGTVDAYREVLALKARVEAAKTQAAIGRLDQLRRDLAHLRSSDPKAWADQVAGLKGLLAGPDS